MKTTDEIIGILKQFKPIAEKKYGLTRIGLFGSVARGEQHDGSDVDVCYEGRIPTLLILDQMQTELEQLFGCPVDMVRIRKQMNPLLNNRIKKEAIYV
ncbi:MAG: nucleotidyltransferase family protein [Prevotella sp.]|nr:nucleotidyltransferase family protein [Prevotella sp.]